MHFLPPPLLLACTDAPRIANVALLSMAMPFAELSVLLTFPLKTAVAFFCMAMPIAPLRRHRDVVREHVVAEELAIHGIYQRMLAHRQWPVHRPDPRDEEG